ncbi:hypothetical protein [Bacillus licheniformis]|uniref:hypothetical protein n=1 Tax=Bacillus licheniformis TaxID=1402 RepID=UPI0009290BFE|nr:hypothetical protein [Bacillus licheniformis]MEC0670430.1 hypothetical protein [Bacillus haynesii]OJT60061.1 hypothetical protein BFP47_04350 [Bacillus licheniformis]OJT66426.1 hypothetical protein BFP46_25100 [Bacillus licheniformis]
MNLDDKNIHDFAIAVVNSTSVEGDSPESIVQKKLELYEKAILQATALKEKADKEEQKAVNQYYKSDNFSL